MVQIGLSHLYVNNYIKKNKLSIYIYTMLKNIEYTIDMIGLFGPLILLFLNLYLFFYRKYYLYSYIIFFFINGALNKLLKQITKIPRPKNQLFFNKLEKLNGVEKYGMPSGHAQSIGYSIAFLCNMIISTNKLFILALFIGLITIYQRFKYRRHTIPQLGIGLIIGLIFGNLVYNLTKYIIQH